MPASSLSCRACGTAHTADTLGPCTRCFGPLDPVYDWAKRPTRESIARTQSSGHVAPRHVPIAPVDRLLAQLEDMRRHRCGELTLRDLVDEAPRPQLSVARGAG